VAVRPKPVGPFQHGTHGKGKVYAKITRRYPGRPSEWSGATFRNGRDRRFSRFRNRSGRTGYSEDGGRGGGLQTIPTVRRITLTRKTLSTTCTNYVAFDNFSEYTDGRVGLFVLTRTASVQAERVGYAPRSRVRRRIITTYYTHVLFT